MHEINYSNMHHKYILPEKLKQCARVDYVQIYLHNENSIFFAPSPSS